MGNPTVSAFTIGIGNFFLEKKTVSLVLGIRTTATAKWLQHVENEKNIEQKEIKQLTVVIFVSQGDCDEYC